MGFRDDLVLSRNGRIIDVLLDYVLMFFPQFIQPSGSPATEVMEFTLPQCFMPWTPAVAHYLRQNLLIFLHIPKYTDSYVEHHFKVCNTASTPHWYHCTSTQTATEHRAPFRGRLQPSLTLHTDIKGQNLLLQVKSVYIMSHLSPSQIWKNLNQYKLTSVPPTLSGVIPL